MIARLSSKQIVLALLVVSVFGLIVDSQAGTSLVPTLTIALLTARWRLDRLPRPMPPQPASSLPRVPPWRANTAWLPKSRTRVATARLEHRPPWRRGWARFLPHRRFPAPVRRTRSATRVSSVIGAPRRLVSDPTDRLRSSVMARFVSRFVSVSNGTTGLMPNRRPSRSIAHPASVTAPPVTQRRTLRVLRVRARRGTPPCGPVMLATLAAAVTTALEQIVENGAVVALEQTARTVTIELRTRTPLTRIQQGRLAKALRAIAPTVRWPSTTTLRISLPVTTSDAVALAPCVPVLHKGRATIWWPLASARHILLAGDAHDTLAAMVGALTTLADANCPLTFALHDPAGELRGQALPRLAATSDALATARLRVLRASWAAQRGETTDAKPPLVLVVAAPDEIVWRDLAPLLATPAANVHVLVLLNADLGVTEARDACHQAQVLEIGGDGVTPLPESHRPPGTVAPRAGEALAWRPGLGSTRGTPLCTSDSARAEWLPVPS
jgi:hypothetical protein